MNRITPVAVLMILALALFASPVSAQNAPVIGIVVMHGKGGSPGGLVKAMSDGLQTKGLRVSSLEMPWSGQRKYDSDVAAAEQQVLAAIKALRDGGAQKLFVAGHSQGAVFGLHFASRHPLDGLIIIAPGGNVGTTFYQQQIGASVSRARRMVADGKGNERADFDEFEGGRGNWTVNTTAATYLSWFEPEGAMNQMKSSAALPKTLPVLHVAPTSDYPALLRAKQEMFDAIPANPLKRLYEPAADHRTAPTAAVDEIVRWTREVAGK